MTEMPISPSNGTLTKEVIQQRQVAAYMQTMEKHASVIQALSAALLTVCALTNGAFFAAFVTYLSSPTGQAIVEKKAQDCYNAMTALGIGFGVSCALMGAVIHYCNVKFSHYRKLLKGEESEDGSSFFQVMAVILITILVATTFYGINQVVTIIIGGQ